MPKRIHHRRAVTLVEVMFAMGVALIGLVGLVSILPVAGRRTQNAINLNDGAALANSVFNQLKARGLLQRSAWIVRVDTGASFQTINPDGFDVSDSSVSITAFDSAIDFSDSWCIDPLFVSSRSSAFPESSGGFYSNFDASTSSATNGYRRMLFPYYRVGHNPLMDPSDPSGPSGTNWFAVNTFGGHQEPTLPNAYPPARAHAFDFGPRMIRVGLSRLGTISPQRGRESEQIVDDRDGIVAALPNDRTLNATVRGQRTVFGGFDLGKQFTDGDLTWIATCNKLPDTDFANVSIVILRKRDRGFPTYLNSEPIADDPSQNMLDERLAYVTYASGFSGGAGGMVEIVGAVNTPSNISPNDWVMLSRRSVRRRGAGPDQVVGNSDDDIVVDHFHRWYRIVSIGAEANELTVEDPMNSGVNHEVWEHKLYLDGPDWSFGFPTPGFADTGAGTSPIDGSTSVPNVVDNTYVTIMKDVVAVSEHVIKLE